MMNLEDKLLQQMEYEKPYITELFGSDKYFNGPLTPDERKLLEEYIHDKNNPQWKTVIIDGKETNYEVSNIGQVRNSLTKENIDFYNYDYLKVLINLNKGSRIVKLVHRLVAFAFIENPFNKPHINHINGIKYCNWYKNLEWVTPEENTLHAFRIGLINNTGENQGNTKYKNSEIENLCKLLSENKSDKEIRKITGLPPSIIYTVKHRVAWNHISKNYKWNIEPKHRKYSDDQIHKACKLLENPKMDFNSIYKQTGVDRYTLKDIFRKHSYYRIAKNYNIPRREVTGEYGKRSKYTDKQIHEVCKSLEKGVKRKDISENYNINISSVNDVYYGIRWKHISKLYNFNKNIMDKRSTTIEKQL